MEAGKATTLHVSGLEPSASVVLRVQRMFESPLITADDVASVDGDLSTELSLPQSAPAGVYFVYVAYLCAGNYVSGHASINVLNVEPAVTLDLFLNQPEPTHGVAASSSSASCPVPVLHLTPSDSSVKAGQSLSVHVSGVPPFSDVFFVVARMTFTPLLTASHFASSAGDVTAQLVIPSDAPAATYSLHVSYECVGEAARTLTTVPLTVARTSTWTATATSADACPQPVVQLSAGKVAAGQPFRVSIRGVPGATEVLVVVSRLTFSPLTHSVGVSSADGSLDVDVTVPSSAPSAEYKVHVSYACEGSAVRPVTTVPLTVTPKTTVALTEALVLDTPSCPQPSVQPSKTSVDAGTTLTVHVSGVPAGVDLHFILSRMTFTPLLHSTDTASAEGQLTSQLHVPILAPAGSYELKVAYLCENDQRTMVTTVKIMVTHGHVHAQSDTSDFEFVLREHKTLTTDAPSVVSASSCPEPQVQVDVRVVEAGQSVPIRALGVTASASLTVVVSRLTFTPLLRETKPILLSGNFNADVIIPIDSPPAADYSVFVVYECSAAGSRQAASFLFPLTITAPVSDTADSDGDDGDLDDQEDALDTTPAVVVASARAAVFEAAVDAACPNLTLTLSASIAKPDSDVQVSITGLLASSTACTLRVAKKGLSPLLTMPCESDAQGTASVTVHLPATAPAGSYDVMAFYLCNGKPVVAAQPLQIATANNVAVA